MTSGRAQFVGALPDAGAFAMVVVTVVVVMGTVFPGGAGPVWSERAETSRVSRLAGSEFGRVVGHVYVGASGASKSGARSQESNNEEAWRHKSQGAPGERNHSVPSAHSSAQPTTRHAIADTLGGPRCGTSGGRARPAGLPPRRSAIRLRPRARLRTHDRDSDRALRGTAHATRSHSSKRRFESLLRHSRAGR